jgi:hypothetical protein
LAETPSPEPCRQKSGTCKNSVCVYILEITCHAKIKLTLFLFSRSRWFGAKWKYWDNPFGIWEHARVGYVFAKNVCCFPFRAQVANPFPLLRLEDIFMGGNLLTGTLPEGFAKLAGLQKMNLSNNSFTGTIPSEFGNMQPELGTFLPRMFLVFLAARKSLTLFHFCV